MQNYNELIGLRFDRVILIELFPKELWKNDRPTFGCLCDCGNSVSYSIKVLRRKSFHSCGCYVNEKAKGNINRLLSFATKHGMHKTPEYQAWSSMKQRCKNKKLHEYKNYGGRGISVCERWENSFENFIADMGKKPNKNYSLDRINNNGNYEPSNCRWATPLTQASNRRDTIISSTGIKHIYYNKKTKRYIPRFYISKKMSKTIGVHKTLEAAKIALQSYSENRLYD